MTYPHFFNFIVYSIITISCFYFNYGYSKNNPSELIGCVFQTTINKKQEIPILNYHQIRNLKSSDSKKNSTYILTIQHFNQQMQMLQDSGYQTILPEQYIEYLQNGTPVPPKPIIITFDDGTIGQYENALPILDKFGFKAVFFIMTITLNKPGYLNNQQIKKIATKGHVIGCHTWDHHNVTIYKNADWMLQVKKPTQVLQEITGKPIKYFAYPYGKWNHLSIIKLKEYGFKCAFQLGGKVDIEEPLFTIKRILVDGSWSAKELNSIIKK
jgi:peptidoglycan/xylan/chitin deacetylase (PgdA/CDA1 family)